MPLDSTSMSAEYAERIPTPGQLHQAAVAAARDQFVADFRRLKVSRRAKNPGLIRRWLFWAALIAGTIFFANHMSDAFARAQADIRIIQSMEQIK
ncbi:hypothetical protein [Gemmobacter sp. 24YEA27]|uniref:hypothetical protein n=1 Tax=Gemmobacter sp. 24YEA27 TaxID=3040672 RepID=UPI0024B3B02B|nr:hypothetical protein [Gemmobacter sp. 24YEA27]